MSDINMIGYALHNDAYVRGMMKSGKSLLEIINGLVSQKRELIEKICDLEFIVPKKYKLPDGTIVVYRPPDDLLEIVELTGETK